METISLVFNYEPLQDIKQDQIASSVIDVVLNYESKILTLQQIKESKEVYVSEEFYNRAEAVKRALIVIKIIYKNGQNWTP